jgi:hypothetical protein
MKTSVIALSLALSSVCLAQTSTIVFRESFGFGVDYQRPKSGKGRMTPVYVGTGVGGFWAEFPADKSVSWMSVDASGVPGWNFAATTPNPYEAPSPLQQGGNGTAWCFNDLGAFRSVNLLVPMSSPRSRYSISAELMPRPILGHYTALGLTNSNVLEDNFESSATVWVRILAQTTGVQGSGLVEFRTQGLTGPSVTGQIPVEFNGFNHVQIVIDPVALTATATVNGVALGTLPVPPGTTKYAGFEGSGGVDNLVVQLVP